MKKMAKRLLLAVSVFFCMVLSTPADELGNIDVQLTVVKVETAAGEEIVTPAALVRPGDVLQYTLAYKIKGQDEVLELLAQLPIPEGMEYLPDSAVPPKVQASLGGSDFSPVPLQRKIRKDNGLESLEEIPVLEYRILGWPMRGLAPGDEKTVSARLRVNFIPEANKAQ